MRLFKNQNKSSTQCEFIHIVSLRGGAMTVLNISQRRCKSTIVGELCGDLIDSVFFCGRIKRNVKEKYIPRWYFYESKFALERRESLVNIDVTWTSWRSKFSSHQLVVRKLILADSKHIHKSCTYTACPLWVLVFSEDWSQLPVPSERCEMKNKEYTILNVMSNKMVKGNMGGTRNAFARDSSILHWYVMPASIYGFHFTDFMVHIITFITDRHNA